MINKIKSFCRSVQISFLTLCGMSALACAFPQQASARITYDATNNGTSGIHADRYRRVIHEIRSHVSLGVLREGVGRETTNNQFFAVDVIYADARLGRRTLTLVFRYSDLYIVGFYRPGPGGTPGSYTRTDDAFPRGPMGYPGNFTPAQVGHIDIQSRNGRFHSAMYDNLEKRSKKHRLGMRINSHTIAGAAHDLMDPNSTVEEEQGAVILFAQLLAEGARFHYIGDAIENGLRVEGLRPNNPRINEGFAINRTSVALENDWGSISTTFRMMLARPGWGLTWHEGNFTMGTIQQYAAVLALCLMTKPLAWP